MYSLTANARAAASRIQDTDFAKESALWQCSILTNRLNNGTSNNAMANILTLIQ